MRKDKPRVYVVDDDPDVRSATSFMLEAHGIPVQSFESGLQFIRAVEDLEPGCIFLDIRMPGMDGVEVLQELARRDIGWPVIVITGHADIALAVETMKFGAIDFLEKPFSEELLQPALDRAVELLQASADALDRRQSAESKVKRLTAREREVLRCLVEGLSNKEVAERLGIRVRTVEMHRANLIKRMGVRGFAEAVRAAAEAGLDSGGRGRA